MRHRGQDPYTYHLDALSESGSPLGPGGGISREHWFSAILVFVANFVVDMVYAPTSPDVAPV